MNQKSVRSKNQVDVGVNRKNKIPWKFFRTDQIAQRDSANFVKFWVMNCKIIFKKIPSANNFFA